MMTTPTLFTILSKIWAKADYEWLTDSQKMALKELKNYLEIHRTVNLFGPVGSGKTFLMWIFTKKYPDWKYLPCIPKEDYDEFSDHNLIIDNFYPATREKYRKILYIAEMYQYKKLILITERPISDTIPMVKLETNTLEDIKKVLSNILTIVPSEVSSDLGYHMKDTSPYNLWKIVNPLLRR